jgi:hypothetical protein
MKEAMKLALEALRKSMQGNLVFDEAMESFKALEEALAKQEHGSPEDMYIEMHKHLNCPYCCGSGHIEDVKQEYGEPWLLKSTQELAKAMAKEFYPEVTQWKVLDDLAGVISQIDNMTTGLIRKPKQEQGEPYAYEIQEGDSFTLVYSEAVHKYKMVSKKSIVATLYTTPQQRTWVGLTHEEIDSQAKKDDHAVYFALGALWAEAKLKEKNSA